MAIGVLTLTCLVGIATSAAAGTPPVISTFAGTGVAGYGGDGGPATSAKLSAPTGMAEDALGDIYLADTFNNRIRRVTPSGVITTVAGDGVAGFRGDGGPATQAQLDAPAGVALDNAGNLYIADSGNNRVRKVSPSGTITTIAGNGGLLCGLLGNLVGLGGFVGPALNATLCLVGSLLQSLLALLGIHFPASMSVPIGIAVDSADNVYIADAGNNLVRKITPGGTISDFAGTGTAGSSGDGGPATSAQLRLPTGVSVDALGNVYISDSGNSKVREVHAVTGIITTFAGNGAHNFGGDNGPASSAQLNVPTGVGIDPSGNVYIADTLNCRIRVVSPGGTISTYAGTGACGYSGDGGPATLAKVNVPFGAIAANANDIYFGDTGNNRGRQIAAGPPPLIPESPLTVALPISGLLLLGAGYVLMRRRRIRLAPIRSAG